ncbi:MerR family transcriptional regulator [Nocardioides bigeumensis]|uniref:HTH-type transcriptional repressor CarH n=1 Tax=Nocardioides bigeumensis TaxID=433657 RepID=A0ABP5K968_9ACTN
MYTVKHAAAMTGISPATLRMWERRYDVVVPGRSPSGYRVYDEAAVRRLSAMRALVEAGWSPRLAAEQVKSGTTGGSTPTDSVDGPSGELGDHEALVRVAEGFDGARLAAVLDEAFGRGTFEEVVDGWLMPALHALGDAWHRGTVSVAGEHFVSATVNRRLAGVLDALPVPSGAPRVIVGLARGSRHELGVLAFAAMLRRVGIDVVYVGGDLPPESWVVALNGDQPDAVVIGVPSSDDIAAVRDTVASLRAAYPDIAVHLGGRHQDHVGVEGSRPLGHQLGPAARDLAAQLIG